MMPSRVSLRFHETIRWMSKDLAFEEPYEGIYGFLLGNPAIQNDRDETTEKGGSKT